MSLNHDTSTNQSYAQWGEDRLVWDFFGHQAKGVFLEIGANHPTLLSQTYLLEQQGWTGVLIEPQRECYELLVAQRPGSQAFRCAVTSPEGVGQAYMKIPPRELGGHVMAEVVTERVENDNHCYEEIALRTINDVLAEAKVGAIDFMSIDIEGLEVPAMRGFDFAKYRPKLILIEDHLEDLGRHRFLVGKGYRFVHRLGSNNWYVPADFSDFTLKNPISRFEYIRKFHLSMPFRKLRIGLKRLRGKA